MKSLFVSVLTLLPLLAGAAMRLDVDHVDVKPKPEDETIEVAFTFKNDGAKPVRILNLESQCSCLSATLNKAEYAPGEAGSGRAQFKISSFVGEEEKTITVTTNDPKQPEWIIPFVITVPPVVDISPKMVQWWQNEAPGPKDVIVKMTGEQAMKITEITSTRENMSFALKEIKAGREYKVTLTPKTTTDIMIGALKIITDSKIPKYQRQLAFFGVVRQPETAKKAEPAAGTAPPAPQKPAVRDGETILKAQVVKGKK